MVTPATYWIRRRSPAGRIDWTGPWLWDDALKEATGWIRQGYHVHRYRDSPIVQRLVARWLAEQRAARNTTAHTTTGEVSA